MKTTLNKSMAVLLLFMQIHSIAYAQNQPDIPKPTGPIDFSETSNIIIFIVIPAAIIIAYLIFRNRIRNIKQEKSKKRGETKIEK
ncbi:hypothetical protein ACFOUP_01605 [Belliella kenyensis]|uniref:CcmD family protein n=1 Tax=Belliella kenyensis TaxID=1472724 RepID=A0ABV8EFS7_9BACT|nr:hypothetical protein [Belliella kenyensis]MCH7401109.1 hypothetical protein [Belliella kenyensis]MDN3604106.1 hypothetical protein [Belliella kenyensis]